MTSNTAELRDLAIAKHQEGERAAAAALYARALAMNPEDPVLLTNLGVLLRENQRVFEALDLQLRASARLPENHGVQSNLANTLDDVGRHRDAVKLRRRLATEVPERPKHLAMLARSLRNAGEWQDATEILEREMGKADVPAEIRLEYAFHQLIAGNYAEGFLHYLARREVNLAQLPKTNLPRWTGQSLSGKTILVLSEQGMGDTLIFARFLPYLRERGAVVHLLAQPGTHRLLKGVEGADAVILDPVPGTDYAYWTSVMDIPVDHFHFREKIPGPTKLHVPDAARERARSRLASFENTLKVGVNWTGSTEYDRNKMRSIPLHLLRDLTDIPGVQLFSLYKGPGLAEYHSDGTAADILDVASDDTDLADCAATIEELDLVISVCTVTTHVAAALGKEVWTLLHWEPFWLYGRTGETTPWYPTMRLFRQETPWEWSDVMTRVRAELTARAATQSCG